MPLMTDTEVRALVARLLGGILAAVGACLGLPFVILGLAGDEGFLAPGIGALVVAVVCGVAGALLSRRARRREEEETAARTSSGDAVVIDARLRLGSRVGSTSPLRLTVRLAGEEVTRTLYVAPTTRIAPGDVVEVRFEPARPANFVLVSVRA